jgi:sigma54-dependent transcription regulator
VRLFSWDNFRDLNAAIVRIATLSPGGRISLDLVREESEHLSSAWAKLESNETQDILSELLGKERLDGIDFFAQVQLARVIRVSPGFSLPLRCRTQVVQSFARSEGKHERRR